MNNDLNKQDIDYKSWRLGSNPLKIQAAFMYRTDTQIKFKV